MYDNDAAVEDVAGRLLDADGQIVLQRCAACGAVQPPYRIRCRFCRSAELAEEPFDPFGRVEAHTVVHQRYRPELSVPYGVALVRLDCGPTLPARWSGPLDALRRETRVRLVRRERILAARPERQGDGGG